MWAPSRSDSPTSTTSFLSSNASRMEPKRELPKPSRMNFLRRSKSAKQADEFEVEEAEIKRLEKKVEFLKKKRSLVLKIKKIEKGIETGEPDSDEDPVTPASTNKKWRTPFKVTRWVHCETTDDSLETDELTFEDEKSPCCNDAMECVADTFSPTSIMNDIADFGEMTLFPNCGCGDEVSDDSQEAKLKKKSSGFGKNRKAKRADEDEIVEEDKKVEDNEGAGWMDMAWGSNATSTSETDKALKKNKFGSWDEGKQTGDNGKSVDIKDAGKKDKAVANTSKPKTDKKKVSVVASESDKAAGTQAGWLDTAKDMFASWDKNDESGIDNSIAAGTRRNGWKSKGATANLKTGETNDEVKAGESREAEDVLGDWVDRAADILGSWDQNSDGAKVQPELNNKAGESKGGGCKGRGAAADVKVSGTVDNQVGWMDRVVSVLGSWDEGNQNGDDQQTVNGKAGEVKGVVSQSMMEKNNGADIACNPGKADELANCMDKAGGNNELGEYMDRVTTAFRSHSLLKDMDDNMGIDCLNDNAVGLKCLPQLTAEAAEPSKEMDAKFAKVTVTAMALSGLSITSKKVDKLADEGNIPPVHVVLCVLQNMTASENNSFVHIPSLRLVKDPSLEEVSKKNSNKYHVMGVWDVSKEEGAPRSGDSKSSVSFSRLVGMTTIESDEINKFDDTAEIRMTPSMLHMRVCLKREDSEELLPVGVAKVLVSGGPRNVQLAIPLKPEYYKSMDDLVKKLNTKPPQSKWQALKTFVLEDEDDDLSCVRFKGHKHETYRLAKSSFIRINLSVSPEERLQEPVSLETPTKSLASIEDKCDKSLSVEVCNTEPTTSSEGHEVDGASVLANFSDKQNASIEVSKEFPDRGLTKTTEAHPSRASEIKDEPIYKTPASLSSGNAPATFSIDLDEPDTIPAILPTLSTEKPGEEVVETQFVKGSTANKLDVKGDEDELASVSNTDSSVQDDDIIHILPDITLPDSTVSPANKLEQHIASNKSKAWFNKIGKANKLKHTRAKSAGEVESQSAQALSTVIPKKTFHTRTLSVPSKNSSVSSQPGATVEISTGKGDKGWFRKPLKSRRQPLNPKPANKNFNIELDRYGTKDTPISTSAAEAPCISVEEKLSSMDNSVKGQLIEEGSLANTENDHDSVCVWNYAEPSASKEDEFDAIELEFLERLEI